MKCYGKRLHGYRCPTCGRDHRESPPGRPAKLSPSLNGPSFALLESAKPVINEVALAETHRQADKVSGPDFTMSAECPKCGCKPNLVKRGEHLSAYKCGDCDTSFFGQHS